MRTAPSESSSRTVSKARFLSQLSAAKKVQQLGQDFFAINALSTRPRANTTGAVGHSTSAVECVLGEIHGKAMTLGDHLKEDARKKPGIFHFIHH
jgi:hypothetical protein